MKINIILLGIFISFIAFAYSGLFEHPTELLGGTELNGAGCVCHTVERDTSVKVWIEGPDTLMIGQTGIYHMYLAGGPAQAGGYNVAGRFGTMVLTDSFSFWDYRSPNELTQAFPLVFPSTSDTIYWEFGYTASDSSEIDTLYSCGLSIVYDGIPDSLDRWNFGPKLPITIVQGTIPVELVSFTAELKNNFIELYWSTSTETNNKGFEVQRIQKSNIKSQNWNAIAFIAGKGTSTEKNYYSFVDKNSGSGEYLYRLKQIDFDGNYTYSDTIQVNLTSPSGFTLYQNFPNPFNPATKISWHSPVSSWQTLKIYDMLGNEIATPVNEFLEAGNHSIELNALDLRMQSGVYIYQIRSGNYSMSGKMILLK
ncbi:choice-of-anchor V domain-containing protein [Ignavibacterium album]|uniref:choice-of-anchor V domain-containing protein n=1 Tax=Ignavibacterium album TaxID=591197 RepID=UPI0026EF9FF0|nr:choice-of-anchor V domain-containing protein [Ignavibacterium album]